MLSDTLALSVPSHTKRLLKWAHHDLRQIDPQLCMSSNPMACSTAKVMYLRCPSIFKKKKQLDMKVWHAKRRVRTPLVLHHPLIAKLCVCFLDAAASDCMCWRNVRVSAGTWFQSDYIHGSHNLCLRLFIYAFKHHIVVCWLFRGSHRSAADTHRQDTHECVETWECITGFTVPCITG